MNPTDHPQPPWKLFLFKPVDIASIVFFRMGFGLIMLWEVYRYFSKGWIERYYIKPTYYFTYMGFDWIQPWSGDGMYIHFVVLALLAYNIMVGFLYRISTVLFFLGFTYIFLLDQTNYLNHFYLISLISFVMIFIPANKAYSIDAKIWPKKSSTTIPAWSVWLLRFQIAVPYFFGGIAKLNADWLSGKPIGDWILEGVHFPVIGPYFMEPWAKYFFAYSGIAIDLFCVPFLLWKRTRVITFIGLVFFHLSNHFLFKIGIFPWFMMAATLIFFEPNWPRRFFGHKPSPHKKKDKKFILPPLTLYQNIGICFFATFIFVQVLLPFRHLLYPGDVNWTEEGHRFSWHMKLRDKSAKGRFIVKDPNSGETWKVKYKEFLSKRQKKKMRKRPYMIVKFAKHLQEEWKEKGYDNVQVFTNVKISLNGRDHQPIVDPQLDLTQVNNSLLPSKWILPLND